MTASAPERVPPGVAPSRDRGCRCGNESGWPEVAEHQQASAVLARHLVRSWWDGPTTTVTWLNHHTAQLVRPGDLAAFDLVGVDGQLLRWLIRDTAGRTSADLVLPLLLPRLHGARVALVGGVQAFVLPRAAVVGALLCPNSSLIANLNGHEGLPVDVLSWVRETRPDVVLVGLGGGNQEKFAAAVAQVLPRGLVITCGGYLDQLLRDSYYPRWAYPLHLNWAVRLRREPRRLWRRYTLEALHAVRRRRQLRELLAGSSAYTRCRLVLTGGAP